MIEHHSNDGGMEKITRVREAIKSFLRIIPKKGGGIPKCFVKFWQPLFVLKNPEMILNTKQDHLRMNVSTGLHNHLRSKDRFRQSF